MKLEELLKVIDSKRIGQTYGGIEILSISTDSRRIEKDSLFIALKGATFDGEDFIGEAVQQGGYCDYQE